jgi:hypothetical protein
MTTMPLAVLHLATGPAMYFGGSIMTFALPYGAFIVAAGALFFLFRTRHSGPKLKYTTSSPFTAIGTREPGPVPAPPVTAPAVAEMVAQIAEDPEMAVPEAALPETTVAPEATAEPESEQ